jgi:hypothetical protein
MSTLKTTNLQNPSAGSPAIVLASDGTATAQLSSVNGGQLAGARNRIINGDMRIDQRNNGASVTVSTSNEYTLDRWQAGATASSKFTVQQNAGSVTPPAGFTNYLGCTSSAATSLAAGDYYLVQQKVEGFNVSDLAWGTANASSVTLSFWVRSSLTGTFGGAIQNSAGNRSYPFTYSISSVNTWEKKAITISGDTSGTWLTTNGIGLYLLFGLGVGSTFSGTAGAWAGSNFISATGATSVVGTNGATFYITGVQLEAGSVATPFERRSYGQELALCQRYYSILDKVGLARWVAGGTYSGGMTYFTYAQTMRTAPSVIRSVNAGIYDNPVFILSLYGGIVYFNAGTGIGDYVEYLLKFSAEL